MDYPILDHLYDDESLISKESYMEQSACHFDKIHLLKEYKIDTALFIFYKEELENVIDVSKLEEFYTFISASNKNMFYIYDKKFLLGTCPLGSSCAAGLMEELGFMGITKFYACGSAGQIDHSLDGSKFVLVDKAIRDEGTSYHYLKPSIYVETDEELTNKLERYLASNNFEYVKATTWTTDAFYRETPKVIEKRVSQGAVSVEMECAGWCAVSKFRGYKFAQLLYFSDALKQEGWKWKVDKKALKKAIIELMIDFLNKEIK